MSSVRATHVFLGHCPRAITCGDLCAEEILINGLQNLQLLGGRKGSSANRISCFGVEASIEELRDGGVDRQEELRIFSFLRSQFERFACECPIS